MVTLIIVYLILLYYRKESSSYDFKSPCSFKIHSERLGILKLA